MLLSKALVSRLTPRERWLSVALLAAVWLPGCGNGRSKSDARALAGAFQRLSTECRDLSFDGRAQMVGVRIPFSELYRAAVVQRAPWTDRGTTRQWRDDVDRIRRRFEKNGRVDVALYVAWLERMYSERRSDRDQAGTPSPGAPSPPASFLSTTADTFGKLIGLWGTRADCPALFRQFHEDATSVAFARQIVEGLTHLGGKEERTRLIGLVSKRGTPRPTRVAILCHIWRMPPGDSKALHRIVEEDGDELVRGLAAGVLLRWGASDRVLGTALADAIRAEVKRRGAEVLKLSQDPVECLVKGARRWLQCRGPQRTFVCCDDLSDLLYRAYEDWDGRDHRNMRGQGMTPRRVTATGIRRRLLDIAAICDR